VNDDRMKEGCRTQIEINTWSLPIAVCALIILQLLAPYQGWAMLLIALGGALLIGYVWARALARGLTFTREIRFGWAQVGDRLEERFTLVNRSWVPAPWLEIRDHSTLPGYDNSLATGVDAHSTNHRQMHFVCTQRGSFMLGPTTLRTGDPFGIFTVTLDSQSFEKMLVLPPVVSLPNIEVASGGLERQGRRRERSREYAANASSVRQYEPGDSMRLIHWRTVARRDDLFVRALDSTPSGDWWILLDLNQGVQAGQGQDSTLEHSIIYSASLAARGLRAGRSVGLVTCGDDLVWLPPRDGEAQRWKIFRALALAKPGTLKFADLLAACPATFKHKASLIIVTPDVNADWVRALAPLIGRGGVPTVLLLDPTSFGRPQNTCPLTSLLDEQEIARYVMTRDMLNRSDVTPGTQGRLEWRITSRGRAILAHSPRELQWRTIA
jgi:uncharacterized protein (DUF58 family)